jgi:predicted Rossmann fold nucleotide-binding protein DprA/Smf involved in DNA uptake
MPSLSLNTQAILLLTAPLIAGRNSPSADLLTQGEYKKLARHLLEMKHQPADLLSPGSAELVLACQPVIREERLQRLLGRGFLLSQAVERWKTRSIWVVSRADPEYPRRLKARLKEDAPAILYGCGDMCLLEMGGLAVVGSRHVDESLIDYTLTIGYLAARADKILVSGGAKGVDQAAMRGALDAGGKSIGMLADSLEKQAMNREHRQMLLDGNLVLVSPYDPNAGFNVGNAMQRNKLIYAMADAALVISSDFKKGGTWAGAVEQLDKWRFVPIYVRSIGESMPGLDALYQKGAILWPNPPNADAFLSVFAVQAVQSMITSTSLPVEATLPLFVSLDETDKPQEEVKEPVPAVHVASLPAEITSVPVKNPADVLFAAVSDVLQQLLQTPMKDTEIAASLAVSRLR